MGQDAFVVVFIGGVDVCEIVCVCRDGILGGRGWGESTYYVKVGRDMPPKGAQFSESVWGEVGVFPL